MKKKKKKKLMAVGLFRDPALSDRHLLLLLLYELTKLRSGVAVLQNLQTSPGTAAQYEKLCEFCHQQAFDELEDAIKQFETQGQRSGQQ